jgi:hypothetical protein
MAARADVPRAPVRSGLGEIRGLTFLSLVIQDRLRGLVVPSKLHSSHRANALTARAADPAALLTLIARRVRQRFLVIG